MKDFARKLYDKEISDAQKYHLLLTDIDSGKIKNNIDLLNYCNYARLIELKNYPDDPKIYLEAIHRDVAALLPELAFTDFKFRIELDSTISDAKFKAYNAIVSLKAGDKIYQQASFIHVEDIGKYELMHYFGKIDQQEFYNIFNKILADHESPYRLHEVKAYQGNATDWDRFGIIALTKAQANMLHGGGVYFVPSYKSFKNNISTKTIEKAIAAYQKIGLFDHLSAEQIKKAKEKADIQSPRNLNEVLDCFSGVIYNFDTELSNLDNPYEEILQNLADISNKAFNPVDITDKFSKPKNGKFVVGFTCNGHKYFNELKVQDDWIDPNFMELVERAVKEEKLEGKFYFLYTGGQEASIIFLTNAQYNYIRENKLLVFGDEWQSQEE